MQISAEPGRTSAVGSVRSATWPFRTRVWKSVVRAVAAAMHKPEPSLRPRHHSRCRHRQHGADSHAISTVALARDRQFNCQELAREEGGKSATIHGAWFKGSDLSALRVFALHHKPSLSLPGPLATQPSTGSGLHQSSLPCPL